MDFFDFQKKLTDQAQEARKETALKDALTVSQLTSRIERSLQEAFPAQLRVRGEVSDFTAHGSSGHIYFTLKDASACIDCVMFRSDAARLRFVPQDGLELVASGHIAVYPQRGRYQLYVSRLDPLGEGALQLAFRQLHARLEAEGLFDPARKKPIPAYPVRLALVTSTQTAALQDMLKILRRFSFLHLLVYHVPVQGEGAAAQIAGALTTLSKRHQGIGGIDVILLARGGGSLEDLWAFNEEIVARAVAASTIPIITGVGHEVDVSIADLVADHHAHTPTEAAQVATRNWRAAGENLELLSNRLRREARNIVQHARQRLATFERHALFARPLDRIASGRQYLDDRRRALQLGVFADLRSRRAQLHELTTRLEQHRPSAVLLRMREQLASAQQRLWRAMSLGLRQESHRLLRLTAALQRHDPAARIDLASQRVESLQGRMDRAALATLRLRTDHLQQLTARLNALGPDQVLRRGYAIASIKKTGRVLRRPDDVKGGEMLIVRLSEGQIEVVAEDPKQPSLPFGESTP